MPSYHLGTDLSELLNGQKIINELVFPRLHQAVGAIAQKAEERWKEAVFRSDLWVGEKRPYMDSIKWSYTGPFSAEVVSDFRYASEIESGRPARDLKRMLDSSMKVRISAQGKRYLIIPMRHNVKELQASGVYQQAKALRPSSVTGQTMRPSGTGAMDVKTKRLVMVPQAQYKWGGRLKSDNKQLNGLHRFNTSTGGAKSSSYLTFRTMVEGSPGWIVKAKPGLFIVRGVVDGLQSQVNDILQEAVRLELS